MYAIMYERVGSRGNLPEPSLPGLPWDPVSILLNIKESSRVSTKSLSQDSEPPSPIADLKIPGQGCTTVELQLLTDSSRNMQDGLVEKRTLLGC